MKLVDTTLANSAKKEPQKGIVILSGGMDSTVLAYHFARLRQLEALVSVFYGQRHSREINCAQATAKRLCVPHIVLSMGALGVAFSNSALTCKDNSIAVPHGHYAEDSMKATVVPNRNMILLSLAVGVAINRGAAFVAYGAHAGDHAIYPDCRPEFADAIAHAVSLCDWKPPHVLRPFIDMTKADIVRAGVRLNVHFDETWTCYEGGEVACGKCGTCVERLEAFALADTVDPLEYQDRISWRETVKAGVPSSRNQQTELI